MIVSGSLAGKVVWETQKSRWQSSRHGSRWTSQVETPSGSPLPQLVASAVRLYEWLRFRRDFLPLKWVWCGALAITRTFSTRRISPSTRIELTEDFYRKNKHAFLKIALSNVKEDWVCLQVYHADRYWYNFIFRYICTPACMISSVVWSKTVSTTDVDMRVTD